MSKKISSKDYHFLKWGLDEAVKSMDNNQGFRAGLYLRALSDYINRRKTTNLEVVMDSYRESKVCEAMYGRGAYIP